jgi:hypothetical protein
MKKARFSSISILKNIFIFESVETLYQQGLQRTTKKDYQTRIGVTVQAAHTT